MADVKMQWAIKESLLGYMASIEDGVVEADAPAVRTGAGFEFSADAAEFDWDALTGTLEFGGTARLSGYNGAMKIELKAPRIEMKDGRGTLSVLQGGLFSPAAYSPVVSLEVRDADGTLVFDTNLLASGAPLFGPQYQPGQEFSPLTLSR